MKCHIFDKIVKQIFNGLTGVNTLFSISGQEITEKDQFLSCPSEQNVRSLHVIHQSQNSLGTAMRMWATFNLSFRSIAFIGFDLFRS